MKGGGRKKTSRTNGSETVRVNGGTVIRRKGDQAMSLTETVIEGTLKPDGHAGIGREAEAASGPGERGVAAGARKSSADRRSTPISGNAMQEIVSRSACTEATFPRLRRNVRSEIAQRCERKWSTRLEAAIRLQERMPTPTRSLAEARTPRHDVCLDTKHA